MKIVVLYDNEVLVEGTKSGHGFAALINGEEFDVLFDTGWSGPVLLHNAKKLGVNLRKIKYIFLSHQHWDHIGGLPDVLAELDSAVNFVIPSSFTRGFKRELSSYGRLIEIGERPVEFEKGFFSTGEMDSDIGIREHALFISRSKRVLLVGCSHPDVYNMVKRFNKVDILIGGFHDFLKIHLLDDVVRELIFPCHCTVKKKEIHKLYPEKSKICGTGLEVKI